MSSGNELMELIDALRVPNRVGTVDVLNRLLELTQPFVSATVRIYSREHHAYWRAEGVGYVTARESAGVWSLYDAWRTTRHLGHEKQIIFELVRDASTDYRPTDREAVDRAARRFADTQLWDWDKMHETDETRAPVEDGTWDQIVWSRNRCRAAVYDSIRLYREEENRP